MMRVVLVLACVSLFGCSTARYVPTSMKEKLVEDCIDLCRENPSINLSVAGGDQTVYRCTCAHQ